MPATQKFEPKFMQPRYFNIMRLQLKNFTKKEIAEIVGMSEAAVGYITNSDIYRNELARLQTKIEVEFIADVVDVRKEISDLSKKAIRELKDVLYDPEANRKLKVDVAFDILDRDGYKAPEERHVTVEWTDAVRKAHARRQALKNQKVVELFPTPEEDLEVI